MTEYFLQSPPNDWLAPLRPDASGPDEEACCSRRGPESQSRSPHRSGCMVCGAELVYLTVPVKTACHACGKLKPANARCIQGHFVCDSCHSEGPVEIVARVCLASRERNAVALMQSIRAHPRFGIHGPEHHSLVPAVILAALRNQGRSIPDEWIRTAAQRGTLVPGGACAFMGACGAAIGVGIAISVLLEATPYEGRRRQLVQQATQRALARIASLEAPRCCQRDAWLALQEASRFLEEILEQSLEVDYPIACDQTSSNKECIHARCPLWPASVTSQVMRSASCSGS